MNRVNIDKLNNCFTDIKNNLNLTDDYINYMFEHIEKSTDGKKKIMFTTYDYLIENLNYTPYQALSGIFKYYGNVNLLQKFINCEKYKDTINKVIDDYNVKKDNISEKHFNSVGYYTILTQFLKGKMDKCPVCGKYTLNTYCSIACNKIAQINKNKKV